MLWSKLPLKCCGRLSASQVLRLAKTTMVLTILFIFQSSCHFCVSVARTGWKSNTRTTHGTHGDLRGGSVRLFSCIHLCFYYVCRVRPGREEHSTVRLLLGHDDKKEMIIMNPINGQKFNTHTGKYYIFTAKGQIGPTGFYFSGVMNTTIINSSESLFVLAY